MDSREFADLKGELKTGNNERLKSIFESNAAYCISKLLFKHRCSRDDAEDIYTDSILNLRDRIITDKIDALIDLRAYLYATCKNMILVRIKKELRVNNAASEFYQGYSSYSNETGEDEDQNFKDGISEITKEALSVLPDKCKKLLKAFYFDKLSMEQIAKEMEFANENVAKVSKSRCFQKLVDQIKIIQKEKSNVNDVIK